MRNIVCCVFLAIVGATAQAGGTASVTCGSNGAPVLNVNYSPGADVGTPGLFWLGALSPDQTGGAVLTGSEWIAYQGGLYPFQARYDSGLPGSISLAIPFPGNVLSTANYVGYGVYLGHGAYTAQARQKIVDRRAALNSAKASLVAAGRWNSEYDSDDRFIWSLIQKDMVDGQKYGVVTTVPFVDCSPDLQINGG